MPSQMLLAYLTFTFVLVVTPGAATTVVIRNTLDGGRAAGLAAAAGAAVGNTSHATAAGLGLSLLLGRWPAVLGLIRVAGGLYLAWLGLVSFWRASRPSRSGGALAPPMSPDQRRASFWQGLMVNLLNPPIITFYLVVVPSFMPAGGSGWYFAVLAAIHVSMAFCCHGAWAVAFDRVRELLTRPLSRRILEAATGVALLGLAVRVLW
jgi:threonine/homoserine/homoserine lactone efflux protein